MKAQELLFQLQDKSYRDFQSKLIPTIPVETIIGVRPMYGRAQPAPQAEKDHRPGAGHRPDGGRGRPLRGYSCADQCGQIRAARLRQGRA